ncbi:MAG TPA: TetR/AcrR family transcriptional regulator [Gammaproteobacteria bacterium]|nr:TetR/AcrR family transcriptional regulator [Gammaproteobacteria bacterium]
MALQAAEAIVAARGLAGLSARKIASGMGYTVGSLYLVFRNLDDLILHMNGRTLDALYQALRQRADGAQGEDGVLALAHAYVDFAGRHQGLWDAVFQFRRPQGEALPGGYQAKVRRMFALVEERLAPVVPDKSPTELVVAARALWSGVHGVCTLSLTGSFSAAGVQSVRELVDSLVRNYLRGLSTA